MYIFVMCLIVPMIFWINHMLNKGIQMSPLEDVTGLMANPLFLPLVLPQSITGWLFWLVRLLPVESQKWNGSWIYDLVE